MLVHLDHPALIRQHAVSIGRTDHIDQKSVCPERHRSSTGICRDLICQTWEYNSANAQRAGLRNATSIIVVLDCE